MSVGSKAFVRREGCIQTQSCWEGSLASDGIYVTEEPEVMLLACRVHMSGRHCSKSAKLWKTLSLANIVSTAVLF